MYFISSLDWRLGHGLENRGRAQEHLIRVCHSVENGTLIADGDSNRKRWVSPRADPLAPRFAQKLEGRIMRQSPTWRPSPMPTDLILKQDAKLRPNVRK